jgi:heme/copper-type cytochrome/quinol oxidase subunit 2
MPIEVKVVSDEEYSEWVGLQLAGETKKVSISSAEPENADVLSQTDVATVKPATISMSSQEEVK